jgi:hypothetical protein
MNYKNFKFITVVDFIEIEIVTTKSTNFPTVKRAFYGDVSYVTGIDGDDKTHAASKFRFRIQDPKRWLDIMHTLNKVYDKFELVSTPVVTAIEVSFDAYSKEASRDEQIDLVRDFYKYFSYPTSDNRRFGGLYKGGVDAANHNARNRRFFDEGRVMNIGNATDDLSYRLYFKTVDKCNKEDDPVKLPIEEHRSRIEVTFRGAALPQLSLEEWRFFKFETLRKPDDEGRRLFHFRKLEETKEPIRIIINEYKHQIGERSERKNNKGRVVFFASGTKANRELNDIARNKFRELSDRWQR